MQTLILCFFQWCFVKVDKLLLVFYVTSTGLVLFIIENEENRTNKHLSRAWCKFIVTDMKLNMVTVVLH